MDGLMDFIVLRIYTFIHVFIDSMLTFYQYKNLIKSSQLSHTGPLMALKIKLKNAAQIVTHCWYTDTSVVIETR